MKCYLMACAAKEPAGKFLFFPTVEFAYSDEEAIGRGIRKTEDKIVNDDRIKNDAEAINPSVVEISPQQLAWALAALFAADPEIGCPLTMVEESLKSIMDQLGQEEKVNA